MIRDTAASPSAAGAAVDELAGMGVAAIAGEYHSVAARAAAARADAAGIPFLCSSAVLDELTDRPTTSVARLAPPQSRGWRIFAEHMLHNGHRKFVAATEPSIYRRSGARILNEVIVERGGELVEVDVDEFDSNALRDRNIDAEASALLLLVGFPDPAMGLVEAMRTDSRIAGIFIRAPAGQPEFAAWAARLGSIGAGIPFLRYMPQRQSALARRVGDHLGSDLGEPPSFVAFEGYDTIAVLAAMLTLRGAGIGSGGFGDVSVRGTRGTIEFDQVKGTGFWQWTWAPIQVVDRNPAAVEHFRVLYVG